MPRGAHLLPLLLIAAQLAGALDGEECPGTSVAVLIPASPFLQYKLKVGEMNCDMHVACGEEWLGETVTAPIVVDASSCVTAGSDAGERKEAS